MEKETAKIGVIVVDFQADFTKFKNGSLAVEGTDEAFIKRVEENTKKLKEAGFPIFGTLDWHPANHISFFTSHKGKKAFDVIKIRGKDQVLWPPHCVQNTPGAEVLLDKKLFKAFVKTATDPQFEGYSGFQDDGGKKTDLDKLLKKDQDQQGGCLRNCHRLLREGNRTRCSGFRISGHLDQKPVPGRCSGYLSKGPRRDEGQRSGHPG